MKKTIEVLQTVEVTVDETRFTPEFLEAFRGVFYPFEDIEDHMKHLAQLHARGFAENRTFIEGYGPAEKMGITFKVVGQEEIVVTP